MQVNFDDDKCMVRDKANALTLMLTGTLCHGLYQLDAFQPVDQSAYHAFTLTPAMIDAELWHARMGHVNFGSLMLMQRHNMLADLPLMEKPPDHICEGCILGKMHRFSFPRDQALRATAKLQLIHSDLCGPMQTKSLGGCFYFATFIDDFSRICWVYPLTHKSQVYDAFLAFVALAETESGCKIKTLRSDRGGEYVSHMLNSFLESRGIKHQYTTAYTPQQQAELGCRKEESVTHGDGQMYVKSKEATTYLLDGSCYVCLSYFESMSHKGIGFYYSF